MYKFQFISWPLIVQRQKLLARITNLVRRKLCGSEILLFKGRLRKDYATAATSTTFPRLTLQRLVYGHFSKLAFS